MPPFPISLFCLNFLLYSARSKPFVPPNFITTFITIRTLFVGLNSPPISHAVRLLPALFQTPVLIIPSFLSSSLFSSFAYSHHLFFSRILATLLVRSFTSYFCSCKRTRFCVPTPLNPPTLPAFPHSAHCSASCAAVSDLSLLLAHYFCSPDLCSQKSFASFHSYSHPFVSVYPKFSVCFSPTLFAVVHRLSCNFWSDHYPI